MKGYDINGIATGKGTSKGYAKAITISVFALMALGIVMITSALSRVDRQPQWFQWFGDRASKQMLFAGAAFVVLLIIARLNYRRLAYKGRLLTWPGFYLLLLAVVLLAAVYIPGVGFEVNGARRWLKAGPVSFQPSEFAKFVLVIVLAAVLSHDAYPRKRFFRGLLPLCIVAGVICGLVGKEDFGTAALIALVAATLLIAGAVRVWQMVLLALPALAGFAYLIISKPYRLRRLTVFRNIWSDPQESGYHAIQSLIAIAAGGWWGTGLGRGLQKYGYLPEDATDFIFSIVCEELGMTGAVLVMGLVAVLIFSAWQIFRRCRDPFGKLLAFGIAATIGLQTLMNIAVATVSVPTKGIALPFVSAGGSGLIFSAAALGLVCSVARFSRVDTDNQQAQAQ